MSYLKLFNNEFLDCVLLVYVLTVPNFLKAIVVVTQLSSEFSQNYRVRDAIIATTSTLCSGHLFLFCDNIYMYLCIVLLNES